MPPISLRDGTKVVFGAFAVWVYARVHFAGRSCLHGILRHQLRHLHDKVAYRAK